jgi:ABC-type uncharacterized transport system involved in gliding motility auxiliary subunit
MKKLAHLAGPIGLALLVIGSGWAALVPASIPWLYQSLLVAGALLAAIGLWTHRSDLLAPAGTRRARQGAGALASVAVAVGIVLLVNFLGARYNERYDFTRARSFSLHPATERVLKALPEGVEVVGFFPQADRNTFRSVRILFETLAASQPKLKLTVADPNQQPDLYERLGRPGSRVTVVHRGDRRVVLPGFEEGDIAAALLEVGREQSRVVYWVIGHDERAVDARGALGYQRLQSDLIKDYYEIRTLSLGAGEKVPADAALVVIADPRRPVPPAEVKAYDDFLRRGGRLLALVDVDAGQGETQANPLAELLERWGLFARRGLVLDPRERTGDRDPRNVVGDRFLHNSVSALDGQLTLFPQARPVEFGPVMDDQQVFHYKLVELGAGPPGQGKDPFVSADPSLALRPAEELASLPRPGQPPEPVAVAIGAFRKFTPRAGDTRVGREARAVLVGDADFLNDAHFDQVANRELALNVVRWLTGEELLIRREGERRQAREAMMVSPAQMNLVIALALGAPIVVFLVGWIVWLTRRSK